MSINAWMLLFLGVNQCISRLISVMQQGIPIDVCDEVRHADIPKPPKCDSPLDSTRFTPFGTEVDGEMVSRWSSFVITEAWISVRDPCLCDITDPLQDRTSSLTCHHNAQGMTLRVRRPVTC